MGPREDDNIGAGIGLGFYGGGYEGDVGGTSRD